MICHSWFFFVLVVRFEFDSIFFKFLLWASALLICRWGKRFGTKMGDDGSNRKHYVWFYPSSHSSTNISQTNPSQVTIINKLVETVRYSPSCDYHSSSPDFVCQLRIRTHNTTHLRWISSTEAAVENSFIKMLLPYERRWSMIVPKYNSWLSFVWSFFASHGANFRTLTFMLRVGSLKVSFNICSSCLICVLRDLWWFLYLDIASWWNTN